MDHHKTLALAFFFLQPLDFCVSEFDDLAAGQTDHVIMMLMAKNVLVQDLALTTLKRGKETAFDKQTQGSVNRCT